MLFTMVFIFVELFEWHAIAHIVKSVVVFFFIDCDDIIWKGLFCFKITKNTILSNMCSIMQSANPEWPNLVSMLFPYKFSLM